MIYIDQENENGTCSCKGRKVTLGIALRRILELNEHKQTMTANVWVRQYWADEDMAWDPERYDITDVAETGGFSMRLVAILIVMGLTESISV